MASYSLLDQAAEDALHQSRLLNVEERPFKRITKRILAPDSILSAPPTHLPTPPPDADPEKEEDSAGAKSEKTLREERRQFREDVLLDFAAFESSIVRIQFLLNSNARERERYASEKVRIQATAQQVRESTVGLRAQLEEAQKTLDLRKSYDELAERITSNRMLRPRADQHANLDKLNHEIAQLERESREYAQTWAERREQFGKIIEEGMQLRRLIRDEKEEVERREGMEGRGEEPDEVDGASTGGGGGRASTAATPRPEAGGATPLHPGIEAELSSSSPSNLTVERALRPRGKSPLGASPLAVATAATPTPPPAVEPPEDTEMAEDGEVSGDEKEEGAASSSDEHEERRSDRRGQSEDRSAVDHMETQ